MVKSGCNKQNLMLGLILWAILVIIIVICACPGFFTFFFCVALPVGITVYALVSWLNDKFSK